MFLPFDVSTIIVFLCCSKHFKHFQLQCELFPSCLSRLLRDPSGFIPSPIDRYRQILLPTLRLFQVILTSTTMNHQQGAAQVTTEGVKHKENNIEFFWGVEEL